MKKSKKKNNFGFEWCGWKFLSNAVVGNASPSSEKDTNKLENEHKIIGTIKITDLNTDCMEAIFMYLSFTDLSNIVESSKQFHTAAFEVYQKNYASKMLMYAPHRNRRGYYYG